ncbi:MAG: tripartite tricarboxylate transporter permease [Thermodesulfobacteriota bacterium]
MKGILLFCLVGSYSVENNTGDVIIMIIFGMVGYLIGKRPPLHPGHSGRADLLLRARCGPDRRDRPLSGISEVNPYESLSVKTIAGLDREDWG